MFLTKVKLVTLSLLAFGFLAIGVGVGRYQRLAAQQPLAGQAQAPAGGVAKQQPTEEEQAKALITVDVDKWNKAVDATNMTDKLKTLLKERLKAVEAEAQARWGDFLAGRGSFDVLFALSWRLRDAELEMSPMRADQLSALESHWKRMKKIEEVTKMRFDSGRIPTYDYEESRYHRLNAEIQLERAKLGRLPHVEN